MRARGRRRARPGATRQSYRLLRNSLSKTRYLYSRPGKSQKVPGGTIRWLPKDYKQALDALQRLACLALAIWTFTQTRNLLEFTGIMTVGYIGPGGAKEMLVRVLKSVLTEGK